MYTLKKQVLSKKKNTKAFEVLLSNFRIILDIFK